MVTLLICAHPCISLPHLHSPVIGCRQECFTGGHFDIPHHIRVTNILLQTQLSVHLPQLDDTVSTTCDQKHHARSQTEMLDVGSWMHDITEAKYLLYSPHYSYLENYTVKLPESILRLPSNSNSPAMDHTAGSWA